MPSATGPGRAADRFLREVLRGIVDEQEIKKVLDRAIAASIAEFLDTPDAATYLSISSEWLEIARHKGEGPPFSRITRVVRYKKSDLDAWMAERRVEPEAA